MQEINWVLWISLGILIGLIIGIILGILAHKKTNLEEECLELMKKNDDLKTEIKSLKKEIVVMYFGKKEEL